MHSYLLEFLRRLKLGHLNTANPVLVYQMGKVASRSIYHSLKATGQVNVYHIHRMNPVNIHNVRQETIKHGKRPLNEQKGLYLYRNIVKPRKPAKFITLIREPISRNISAYFQNINLFFDINHLPNKFQIERYIHSFLAEYNHNVPLVWFDIEMKAATGIDVYQYPFPKKDGYQFIHEAPFELLILRHDLDDREKAKIISGFLDIEPFSITRTNQSADKTYAKQYAAFLSRIKIPVSFANRMLQSKYAQHFFSSQEIDRLINKWTSQVE